MIRRVAVWALALACAAWTVVRLLDVEFGFPGTPLLAYTPVVAGGAAVLAVVALVLRVRLAAVPALISAVVLGATVAPRLTDDRADDAAAGRPLRVLTANVANGRVSATRLVELVRRRRVDVLSLQEVTPILDAALRTEGREALLPHAVANPRGDSAGTALYSRFPLTEIEAPRPTRHVTTAARLRLPSGSAIEVLSVHPPAPKDEALIAAWRRELGDMPPARPGTRPRLLAGDFNATFDHPEFRELLETGYADAAERDGQGLRPTWPRDRLVPPPVVIDHVLVDDRCAVTDAEVIPMAGSDHRAVLAVLDLAPCL